MALAHNRSIEHRARFTSNKTQQALRFRRISKIGAVPSSILQAVRDEDLSHDLAGGITQHTESNSQLAFVNIETNRCSFACFLPRLDLFGFDARPDQEKRSVQIRPHRASGEVRELQIVPRGLQTVSLER